MVALNLAAKQEHEALRQVVCWAWRSAQSP